MNTKKLWQQIIGLTLAVWLLSGCGGTPTEPPTAPTPIPPTAASGMPNPASAFCEEQGGRVEIRAAGEGGEVGYCVFPDGSECEEWAFFRGECAPGSRYQPLSSAVCSDLADAVAQTLNVGVTTAQAPFEDYVNRQMGTGCRVTATGTGLDFENVVVVFEALATMLQARGWQEDIQYAGGGPTGILAGYRQANALCLSLVGWEPSEDADCPSDQPIDACQLSPEQKLYRITLNCAQDTSTEDPQATQPDPEPKRIRFVPGTISAQVQGSLALLESTGVPREVANL